MIWPLLVLISILISLLPVKLAAMTVRAQRTGFGWCFLATIVAGMLHMVGLNLPGPGNVVAILLGAAGYSAILRTSYAGGLAITVLQFIFAAGLVVILSMILGVPHMIPSRIPLII